MKLTELFLPDETLAVSGALDRPISGIVIDSRRACPGSLFFALPGLRSDGARFVDEAIDRGAVAVVVTHLPLLPNPRATFIKVADVHETLARAARRFHRAPDAAMKIIGVTGTNGKTTITHLIRHLLAEEGQRRVGLLGTIHYDLGLRTVPSFKTTPEAPEIFGMLAQMRSAGCAEAVMEISSHGIDQKRVSGLSVEVAVFSNLTRDHLDYHKTIEAYFEVKARLFTGGLGQPPKYAVVNLDDPRGNELIARIPTSVNVVSYGENQNAMVRAEAMQLGFKRTGLRLVFPGGNVDVESPLIGKYNVSNLLAALATLHALGHDLSSVVGRLQTFRPPAGRMERIEEGQSYNVLVDYAHTDDALRNALGMLRTITPGKLLVIYGCGGNRDRSKRPLMTRAVQEFADFAWATADNPRTESLARIFEDMREGVVDADRIQFVEDRRRAISSAIEVARPGDSILIAGKGHETFQEFAEKVIAFDDRKVVRELIALNQKTLSIGHPPHHSP